MAQKHTSCLLPALYLILVYLTFIWLFFGQYVLVPDLYGLVLLMFAVLQIVVGLSNCILAFVSCRPTHEHFLEHAAMILKYGLIPYFVVYWIGTTVGSLIAFFIGGFGLILGVIFGIIAYCQLFVGSCYVLSYLILMVRTKQLSILSAILLAFTQFMYVLDVIGLMGLLALKRKRYQRITLCVMLGFVFLICIALVLISLS